MSGWTAKRFWKEVHVSPAEGGGFAVTLDGRGVRTPAKAPFVLPTRALAEAAAAEWEAQEGEVRPDTMPVTRSANSAIDTVGPNRAEVVATVAAYGDSDHVCYRADSPAELVARQAEKLDPLLDWAAAELGARLRPVTGVVHAPQDPAALDRLATLVAEFGAFELAAFHDLVALTGSLVIGFAAARAHMPDDALWALSRIDETWQAEKWGVDDEAADLAALKRQAFLEAARIFRLARAAE